MKIVFCLRLLAHLENNNKAARNKATLDNCELQWTWAQNSSRREYQDNRQAAFP